MAEDEIRRILSSVCASLDRRAKSAMRKLVVPGVLGVGLALGGCGDDSGEPAPAYGVPQVDARIDTGPQPDYMAVHVDIGAQPAYLAPSPDAGPSKDDA